jgi:hypothetical protein
MMAAERGQASTVTLLLSRLADTSVIDNVRHSSCTAFMGAMDGVERK